MDTEMTIASIIKDYAAEDRPLGGAIGHAAKQAAFWREVEAEMVRRYQNAANAEWQS